MLTGANGLVWRDDSQVHELHVYRRVDRAKPRLDVEVEAIASERDSEDLAGSMPTRVNNNRTSAANKGGT